MPAPLFRYVALGLLPLIAGPAPPANAEPDPALVATTLAEAIDALGDIEVAYDDATAIGEDVVITGLVVTLPNEAVFTIPAVTVFSATPRDDGGFIAARMTVDQGTLTSSDRTLTWAMASFADVIVPGADEVKDLPKIRPFRQMSMTEINLTGETLPAPVYAATADFELDDVSGGTPTSLSARVTGVRFPAALIGNSIVSALVGMLNYTEFTADVALDGRYDPAANTAVLEMLGIDIATVGKIDIAASATDFSISGVLDPDPEVAQAARSAARLESLRVRIDNAGFVERMLTMQADMLGGTPEDVRKQIVDGALPFALSFVKNEAFRGTFRAEVAEFLADPKSLTIVMSPAEPLPLGQVARAILRAPQTLPDLLAPTVAANEPPMPPPEEPQP